MIPLGPPLTLPLRKFDMSRIKKHTHLVVLIGMRDTGKSVLVKDLLWHHREQRGRISFIARLCLPRLFIKSLIRAF